MSKRESINQEPLTIEELKTMAGLPVWCPEEEAYGIVMCDKIGQWAGIPFLHGVWYSDDDGVGVEFNHNIIMNLLEIWADGSIQGYLSAKQTLKIIERIKARESPR